MHESGRHDGAGLGVGRGSGGGDHCGLVDLVVVLVVVLLVVELVVELVVGRGLRLVMGQWALINHVINPPNNVLRLSTYQDLPAHSALSQERVPTEPDVGCACR